MKVAVGSFTPQSGTNIITINDDETINVAGIIFHVAKAGSSVNLSSGLATESSNRAACTLDSTSKSSNRSNTQSVFHEAYVSGIVTKLAGHVVTGGFAVTGEFEMYFDNADSGYTINYMVVGE